MCPTQLLRKLICSLLILFAIPCSIICYPTVDRYLNELPSPYPGWEWGMVADQTSSYSRFDPTAMIFQIEDPSASYLYAPINNFYPASENKPKFENAPSNFNIYSKSVQSKPTEERFILPEEQIERIVRKVIIAALSENGTLFDELKSLNKTGNMQLVQNLPSVQTIPSYSTFMYSTSNIPMPNQQFPSPFYFSPPSDSVSGNIRLIASPPIPYFLEQYPNPFPNSIPTYNNPFYIPARDPIKDPKPQLESIEQNFKPSKPTENVKPTNAIKPTTVSPNVPDPISYEGTMLMDTNAGLDSNSQVNNRLTSPPNLTSSTKNTGQSITE